MKKHIFAALILVAAICGCSKDNAGKDPEYQFTERKWIELTKSQQDIVNRGNGFAFDLFAAINKAEADKEVFISPFSMEAALCMLSNGAKGDTYSQIVNAMGYKGLSKEEVNSTYGLLTTALLNADNSTKFSIANALWVGREFPVLKSFSNTLSEYYGARVENLDFSSPKALETINSWTNESTNGMIPTLFDRLDPSWVYILTNALYFKGVWSEKFKTDNTYKEDFHCLSGEVRSTDFMHGEIPCGYTFSEDLHAAMCELPFGNKSFLLDILLPDTGIDFNSFVAGLTAEKWKTLTDNLHSAEQYVIIPKMDVSYTGTDSMKAALKATGIVDAFSGSADFSGISEVPTYISDVIQKARFKMDENGAEAAAVTGLIAKETAFMPSSEFMADHPFVYAIREFSTGAILFIGACKNLQ